jgi:hypothetical protein
MLLNFSIASRGQQVKVGKLKALSVEQSLSKKEPPKGVRKCSMLLVLTELHSSTYGLRETILYPMGFR